MKEIKISERLENLLKDRNYNMQTLIQIANKHGITITLEKKGK